MASCVHLSFSPVLVLLVHKIEYQSRSIRGRHERSDNSPTGSRTITAVNDAIITSSNTDMIKTIRLLLLKPITVSLYIYKKKKTKTILITNTHLTMFLMSSFTRTNIIMRFICLYYTNNTLDSGSFGLSA